MPSYNAAMFTDVASASPLLQNLNAEQLAAVTLPGEHALILAGAGSGKTRVLTTRIAWLLQTGQISPGGVLAVTFTNKAAKEMLMRLSARVTRCAVPPHEGMTYTPASPPRVDSKATNCPSGD